MGFENIPFPKAGHDSGTSGVRAPRPHCQLNLPPAISAGPKQAPALREAATVIQQMQLRQARRFMRLNEPKVYFISINRLFGTQIGR
jgi:hypothetical protein